LRAISSEKPLRSSLKKSRRREIATGYILLAPFLAIAGMFILYPILYSFTISFREFSFLDPAGARWIGLSNYTDLLRDERFLTAMKNTVMLVLIAVPCQTVIALLLANVLNSPRLRFKGFFRTLYFLPYVTSPIAVGAVMVNLFRRDGPVTSILSTFGFPNVSWHSSGDYAFWLVVFIIVWTQIGFYTVIYLGGLQSISRDIYEAAAIDGANKFQILLRITVPLLKPTSFLVLVMGILATLQIFEQPFVVSTTGGALPGSPGDSTLTMVMYLYTLAFRYFEMGYASAAAFIIFAIIFTMTLIQFAFFRNK